MTTELARLSRYARWLDSGIRLPGVGWRIGLDPIIGLIPGFGDAAGAVLAGWIFLEAVHRKVSGATLARMAANIAIDAVVGALPVLGDLFDAAWKANTRNVALLERHGADPGSAVRADRRFVAVLITGIVVACAVPIVGGVLLAVRLLQLLGR